MKNFGWKVHKTFKDIFTHLGEAEGVMKLYQDFLVQFLIPGYDSVL